jgi:hypothetical protein
MWLFLVGIGLGFGLAWAYFLSSGLIRSRSEFYRSRRARGLPVPDNWEDDEP